MMIQPAKTAPTVDRKVPEMPELREVAGKVTGQLFFGKFLQEAHGSSLKGKYMHGGRSEEMFQSQLDSIYAESMGKNMKGGPAESIYNRLAPQAARLSRLEASQELNR